MEFAPRMIGDQLVSIDLVEESVSQRPIVVDYPGIVNKQSLGIDHMEIFKRIRATNKPAADYRLDSVTINDMAMKAKISCPKVRVINMPRFYLHN